jgi:histone H3/H4
VNDSQDAKEVMVVVSKLKNYIRSVSGMSTSGNVASKLSDIIRNMCDQAIEKAKSDSRKTVMDRDFD